MSNTLQKKDSKFWLFSKKKKEKNELKTRNNGHGTSGWNKFLNLLQELGKTLQFPIAVLPFAAILNRFGALGISYTSETTLDGATVITNQAGYWISFIIQKPGGVVFDNLPLLFAIGVAFGLAKDHRGEVALVGAVFYLIMAAMTAEHTLPEMMYKKVLTFVDQDGTQWSKLFYVKKIATTDGSTIIGGTYVLSIGVLGGITAGCLSAWLYNRYKEIKLPMALSFFGGRRFVPMLAIALAIPTSLMFAIIWPWIQYVLMLFGNAVANPNNPAVAVPGTTVYAVLNRLLLPFGLHQILNTFFWFQLPIGGAVVSPGSGVVNDPTIIWKNGDIYAFAAGIEGSGLFQSGFFPIMMGGIPMAAVAMIFAAKKENRKQVSGFLGGVAAVSIISGITEPIEFSFVFLSPLLLVVHALMTGVFMAITTAMHIQVGFGFSAGLIDYIVSFAQSWGFANHATGAYHITSNPLWVLLLTAMAGGVYFVVFYYMITKLNIQTPGREEDYQGPVDVFSEKDGTSAASKDAKKNSIKTKNSNEKYAVMATKIINAIGADNFVSVDNCATRLRLILKDNSKINDAQIKAAGAFGLKRLGTESLQIVIGTDVEFVADEIKKQLNK